MIKSLNKYFIGAVIILLAGVNYCYSETVPFDSGRWKIDAMESRVEDYLGQKSLFLKGAMAVVNDSEFKDGTIEYDVAFGPEEGYFGVMWRMQDPKNYEEFYIRADSSGKADANQYSPVFNAMSGMQIYWSGAGYGAPAKYRFNEWNHVKIVVSGKSAEVYINDMEKPTLFINELMREIKPGKVRLWSWEAPAHFANFSYTRKSSPALKGKAKDPEKAQEGTIMSWMVSNAFDRKSLDSRLRLTNDYKQKLTWTKLLSEPSGLANLARVQGIEKGKNCVFARITVVSGKKQVKPFEFGFSERVKVYFNDQLIFSGNDEMMSRDYRFLGTIGYFDELYLPLKKGKNELWIAVSEKNLGGWGVQARFGDMEGISIGKQH